MLLSGILLYVERRLYMVYKIGTIADLSCIVFEDIVAKDIIRHYAKILTNEYGAERNIYKDNGGYILYATPGTKAKELKKFFDYTENVVEFVDVQDGVCSAVYILSSDYGVVIVMSVADAPIEILKEIKDKTEGKK